MPKPRKRTAKTDYELLAELRYSLRLFASFSEASAREAGISPAQHQALLAIKGYGLRGPFSIGDLASRLLIRHHSAVGLAQRLIARGLVGRVRDAEDRRRVHLVLRARGEALLEKLSASHRDELARIGPHIETLLSELDSGRKRSKRR